MVDGRPDGAPQSLGVPAQISPTWTRITVLRLGPLDRRGAYAVPEVSGRPLEVREGQQLVPLGSGRQLSLLGVLLLHPNETVSVDRLVDELWGEAHLRIQPSWWGYVSGLRKRLGVRPCADRPAGTSFRSGRRSSTRTSSERVLGHARASPGGPAPS